MERKEAIEIVRKLYNESLFLKKDKEAMVTLIPEIKESEDESIRKDLINCIEEFPDKIWRGHNKKDIIVWLEKQGKCQGIKRKYQKKINMDIIVTKEKCKKCLYYGDKGCEMWNELSMPMTGEVCNNFEDRI